MPRPCVPATFKGEAFSATLMLEAVLLEMRMARAFDATESARISRRTDSLPTYCMMHIA